MLSSENIFQVGLSCNVAEPIFNVAVEIYVYLREKDNSRKNLLMNSLFAFSCQACIKILMV